MKRTMKVNFFIDRKLWKEFRAICKIKLDQAAAQELRRLIRVRVTDFQDQTKTP